MTKPTKWHVHPAKTGQPTTWASAQSDQSSLCTQWVARGPSFLYVDSKHSDQTGRMRIYFSITLVNNAYLSLFAIVKGNVFKKKNP